MRLCAGARLVAAWTRFGGSWNRHGSCRTAVSASTERDIMNTFLDSVDDLQWLKETHLKNAGPLPSFVCAILEGSEDCPDRISLYAVNDYRCAPWTYVREETADGGFRYKSTEAQNGGQGRAKS